MIRILSQGHKSEKKLRVTHSLLFRPAWVRIIHNGEELLLKLGWQLYCLFALFVRCEIKYPLTVFVSFTQYHYSSNNVSSTLSTVYRKGRSRMPRCVPPSTRSLLRLEKEKGTGILCACISSALESCVHVTVVYWNPVCMWQ